MKLDTAQLANDMIVAAQQVLGDKWPGMQSYAQAEAQKLAQTLVMIQTLKLSGEINDEQARLHLDIQKNATRSVLLTLEGLGILAAEAAIHAALNVVKGSVNTALGFSLI